MSRVSVTIVALVGLVVVPRLVTAQPAPDAPPTSNAQAPSSTTPPPVTPSLHDQCLVRRREIEAVAQATSDLHERTRMLQSLPDCSQPNPVLPPRPPTCAAGEVLVEGACTAPPRQRDVTTELSFGVGWISASNGYDRQTQLVHGIGGINFGVGKFISSNVAVSLRLSGVTGVGGGLAYLGTLGANLQAWAGNVFFGGGLGLGVLAGCDDGCDEATTSGYNLRVGALVGDNVTVAFEVNSIGGLFSDGSLQTASILVGYQSF